MVICYGTLVVVCGIYFDSPFSGGPIVSVVVVLVERFLEALLHVVAVKLHRLCFCVSQRVFVVSVVYVVCGSNNSIQFRYVGCFLLKDRSPSSTLHGAASEIWDDCQATEKVRDLQPAETIGPGDGYIDMMI